MGARLNNIKLIRLKSIEAQKKSKAMDLKHLDYRVWRSGPLQEGFQLKEVSLYL